MMVSNILHNNAKIKIKKMLVIIADIHIYAEKYIFFCFFISLLLMKWYFQYCNNFLTLERIMILHYYIVLYYHANSG